MAWLLKCFLRKHEKQITGPPRTHLIAGSHGLLPVIPDSEGGDRGSSEQAS